MSWHANIYLTLPPSAQDAEAALSLYFRLAELGRFPQFSPTLTAHCGCPVSVQSLTRELPYSFRLHLTAELSQSRYSTVTTAQEATQQLAMRLQSYFEPSRLVWSLSHDPLVK